MLFSHSGQFLFTLEAGYADVKLGQSCLYKPYLPLLNFSIKKENKDVKYSLYFILKDPLGVLCNKNNENKTSK